MRRTLTATALAAGLLIASAGGAFAAGNSDVAQTHPGHQGYISSDGSGGGVPTAHFHGAPGYTSGPGGWGAAVSEAAQMDKGIPHAH